LPKLHSAFGGMLVRVTIGKLRKQGAPALTTHSRMSQAGGAPVPAIPNVLQHHRNIEADMITRRQMTGSTATLLLSGLLAACVSAQKYDNLDAMYNQLNQNLSGEIAQGQVHITRLQGAIKVAVNSELLFPSGGWLMPPAAAQTIAEMAPVLAPMQTAHLVVIGYTDSTPIGPELRQQGIENNQQLSLKRAQTVMQYLISQGVNPGLVSAQGLGDANPVAPNDTPQGQAQNRRVELTLAS
jgi:chemotaxis protein MotB